ncbi:unnamed protein product [Lactuca saligna]|uniref:MULE transposase domain-containing protein n=1 Tax=Lactuca saligna TaxID=75948 RepID=A0AA35ZVC1_LACSI|nr:unnamed protein product [Lactuca saligna]
MQVIIQSRFHYNVSWSKCYRAKCRAMSLIEGRLSDHYAKVWDYGGELLRSNPGQCKGELLTIIGRDANNQVYPIAWAVVYIENKLNWKWFLELITNDLELDGGRGMAVISEQHKGLLEATKEVLPLAQHRQCARHIYFNFRKVYSGVEFKNMFWVAAKSTVEGEFNVNMQKIRDISPSTYEHLMVRDPSSWCRAFYGGGLACEAVENGMTECFNATIVDARKKPLLAMLEEI